MFFFDIIFNKYLSKQLDERVLSCLFLEFLDTAVRTFLLQFRYSRLTNTRANFENNVRSEYSL